MQLLTVITTPRNDLNSLEADAIVTLRQQQKVLGREQKG